MALASASLSSLMGSALPFGLAVLDERLCYRHVNERLAEAQGRSIAEHLGRSVREVQPAAADELEPLLQAVLATGMPLNHCRMAAPAHWDVSYLPIRGERGRTVGVLVQAQESHETQVGQRERDLLLGEIHHRVKNDLQAVSNLLHLQAHDADEAVRRVLRDSQSRLHSMALMHELLYERAATRELELGPYLRGLAGLLGEAYLGPGTAVRLEVVAPAQGLSVDARRAMPCGLLVTELIVNAIKHGFPDGRPGCVSVEVARVAFDMIAVDVVDDGIGLPPDGLATPGFGLRLLPLLARQCHARLERIDVPVGTHCRLLLPLSSAAMCA